MPSGRAERRGQARGLLLWLRGQIELHFADVCLMTLVFALLVVIMTHSVFVRLMGWQPVPENIAWAREQIAAIIGCLLGRLTKIDIRSKLSSSTRELE